MKTLNLIAALALAGGLAAAVSAGEPALSKGAAPAKGGARAEGKPKGRTGKPLSPQAELEASLPEGAPRKLSDLYKFFALGLKDALGADVQAWPVRVTGRSWELLRDAKSVENLLGHQLRQLRNRKRTS